MKKILKNTIGALLSLLVVTGMLIIPTTDLSAATISAPTPINSVFLDAELANVIKTKLGKTAVSDTVTQAELDGITNLTLKNTNTKDLSGIEYLNNITTLLIGNTNVDDLTKLASLTQLKQLEVSAVVDTTKDQVTTLEPISTLVNLESLMVSGQSFTTLAPIASMTKLKQLEVEWNRNLTDITGVSSSKNTLENFRGSYTMINDLTEFSDMPKLRTLTLFDSDVSDVSPLENCVSLESIQIAGGGLPGRSGGVTDVTPLRNLPNLKVAGLRYNAIRDASQFATGFSSLMILQLTNQFVTQDENGPLTVKVSSAGTTEMANVLTDLNGNLITPSMIYDAGLYDGANISWEGLATTDTLVGYQFNDNLTLVNGLSVPFRGEVYAQAFHPQTVFFESNGGSTVTATGDYFVGDLLVEPVTPTRVGFTFAGWFTDDVTFTSPWLFNTDTLADGGVTLYAKWVLTTYNITYDGNGNDGGDVPIDTTAYVGGENIVLPLLVPTKIGALFTGWSDGAAIYQAGDSYLVPTADVTFVAQWEALDETLVSTGEQVDQMIFMSLILLLGSGIVLFIRNQKSMR